MFHSVWERLGSFRNCMKLGAKQGELLQLLQKFVPQSHVEFFTTNGPNPPHWLQQSCFCAFHSLWVHLGLFRNCMKFSAKRGELVQLLQKFVPQSHVGFFATNGPSPTIGPKTNVLVRFVVFGCIWDRFVTA